MTGAYWNANLGGLGFGQAMTASESDVFVMDTEQPTLLNPSGFASRRRFDGIRWVEVERIPQPLDSAGNLIPTTRLVASQDTLVLADVISGQREGRMAVYDLTPYTATLRKMFESDLPEVVGHFGGALAISGDTLVVGEPFTTRGGAGSQQPGLLWYGVVHVFTRNPAGDWGDRVVLTPLDLNCASQFVYFIQFGRAVAIDGDVMVVACGNSRDVNVPQFPPAPAFGFALVFERLGGVWTNTQCLRVPPNTVGGGGCWGVAVRGDRIIASDLRQYAPGPVGHVYVFERNGPGPGNFAFRHDLQASDGRPPQNGGFPSDAFGRTLDLDEDEILVGAPHATPDRNPALVGRGAAYRFRLVNGVWQEERLWASGTTIQPYTACDDALGTYVGFVEGGAVVSTPNAVGAWPGFQSGVVCYYQDPIATPVCDGAANSAYGDGARFEVRGVANSVGGRVGFLGRQFPANTFGLLVASGRPGSLPNPGGAGVLCLGAPQVRIPGSVRQADLQGQWIVGFDLAAPPIAAALPITAGQRWRFQAWYRDVHPTPTSNFSEAVEIEFR